MKQCFKSIYGMPIGTWLLQYRMNYAAERLLASPDITIADLVILRFFFDYMRSRFQESISYELVAKDRLAIGDALKRVSLGYFQKNSTGTILNSITTGLNLLENMGIRMIDNFVGGYLNFLVDYPG